MNSFRVSLQELSSVLAVCGDVETAVDQAGETILLCLRRGGKLLTCGNGGSAADALHLAEELVGRYNVERRALPAASARTSPSFSPKPPAGRSRPRRSAGRTESRDSKVR